MATEYTAVQYDENTKATIDDTELLNVYNPSSEEFNGITKVNAQSTLGITANTDHRGITSGNPHQVTKTEVGLGNVDNTSDVDKPISDATQSALDLKVNKTDIVNDLVSTDTDKPLSANQGKVLKDAQGLIDGRVTVNETDILANNSLTKQNRSTIDKHDSTLKSMVKSGSTITDSDIGSVQLDPQVMSTFAKGWQIDGLTVTNEVDDGIFPDGFIAPWSSTNVGTPTTLDGVVSFTPTSQSGRIMRTVSLISGHVYAFFSRVKASNANVDLLLFDGSAQTVVDHTGSGNYEYLVGLLTSTLTTDSAQIQLRDLSTSGWSQIDATEFMLIDLTNSFSSIPTASDCAKYFPDYFYPTASVGGDVCVETLGANLFDGELELGTYNSVDGTQVDSTTAIRNKNQLIPVTSGENYIISATGISDVRVYYFDAEKNYVSIAIVGINNFTVPDGVTYLNFRINSIIDTSLQVMLNLGSTALPYVDFVKNLLFFTADELKSVPSIADRVYPEGGKVWREGNVSEIQLVADDLVSYIDTYTNVSLLRINKTSLPDWIMIGLTTSDDTHKAEGYGSLTTTGGGFDNINNVNTTTAKIGGTVLDIVLAKGAFADIADAKANFNIPLIRYQLATPTTTQIPSSGAVVSQPNGLASVLPYVEDYDYYGTGISISDIKEVIEVWKWVDGEEYLTEVDLADVTVTEDVGFVVSGLTADDFIEYVYRVGDDAPKPMITVESYNDVVNEKIGVFAYLPSAVTLSVLVANTYYTVPGPFTNAPIESFVLDVDKLEYTGIRPVWMEIVGHAEVSSSVVSTEISLGIKYNGTLVTGGQASNFAKTANESVNIGGNFVLELNEGDTIQLVATADKIATLTFDFYTTSIKKFF